MSTICQDGRPGSVDPAGMNPDDPEHVSPTERTRFWRTHELGPVEWLAAAYRTHRFTRHWHETYALGTVESGGETFMARGERHYVRRGSLVLLNPGDIHDGETADPAGWRYRMLYPALEVLARVASEIAGQPTPAPHFRRPVVEDPEGARVLLAAHHAADRSRSVLERETRLMAALALLVTRHADPAPLPAKANGDHASIRRVCDLIEDELGEDLALETLAAEARMSSWHFLRVFRRETGATPHLYVLQRRLARARRLLEAGDAPADVAAATGFSDQSHLTNRFRRTYGVTPAVFRLAAAESKNLQD
ncbi:MAG TPA: AraC family transcriptional regulator [Stellaceae bacterium]|nr:AraC family transcriptional regulator [Stellaceae bacterium]